jgi:hypothetical protein
METLMRADALRPGRLIPSLLLLLALLGAALPAGAQARPALPQTTAATVTGRMLLPGGAAAAGFARITPIQNGAPSYDATRFADLGVDGRFSFANTPAGTYELAFRPVTAAAFYNPAQQVAVAAGATAIDLGALTLQPTPKQIRGMLQLGGAPLQGIRVDVYQANNPYSVADTVTDSSGAFTFGVLGGTYHFYVSVPQRAPWMFRNFEPTVTFAANNSSETRSVSLVADPTVGTLEGRLVLPDGQPLPPYTPCPTCQYNFNGIVSIYAPGGPYSRYEGVDLDGSFRIPLVAGSYRVEFIAEGNLKGVYTSPPAQVITITGGAVQVGTVRLVNPNARVGGRVTAAGAGVPFATVSAIAADGGVSSAVSDGTGVYTLTVAPGDYNVSVEVDPARGLLDDDSARPVSLAPGGSATVNFELAPAAFQIAGLTVTGEGASERPVTDVEAWAYARPLDDPEAGPIAWALVENGAFTLNVPRGRFSVGLVLPPGSRYALAQAAEVPPPAAVLGGEEPGGAALASLERAPFEVTVSAGGALDATTVTARLRLVSNSAAVAGVILGAAGPATGLAGQVYATPADGAGDSFQVADIVTATGGYSLTLAPGRWLIGYELDDGGDLFQDGPSELALVTVPPEGLRYDVPLTRLDGVVRGRVVDAATRAGLPGQRVALSGPGYQASAVTDAAGLFEFLVPLTTPAGRPATYTMVTDLTCVGIEDCYIGNGVETVTASPRAPALVTASQLTIPETAVARCSSATCAEVNLRLQLRLGETAVTTATVSVRFSGPGSYSKAPLVGGGYETRLIVPANSGLGLGDDAQFDIRASAPRVQLERNPTRITEQINRAARVVGGAEQRGAIVVQLSNIPNFPDPVAAPFLISEGWSGRLRDGTSITIPANAVPVEPGDARQATITVEPTTDLPYPAAFDSGYPYGYVIRISRLRAGQSVPVTRLLRPAEITLRYSEAALRANSINESWARPAILGERGWSVPGGYTADRKLNGLSVRSTALGTFALMQPTPPHKLYLPLVQRR